MSHIATLLEIQKQARDCKRIVDLAFVAVNKIHQLVSMDQSVFWTYESGKVKLISISGGQEIDPHGSYALWLSSFIERQIESSVISGVIEINSNHEGAGEWLQKYHSIVPFVTMDDEFIGGIWIDRDDPLSRTDKDVLNELSEYLAHCLQLLNLKKRSILFEILFQSKMTKWILLGLILIMFLPVRLSMTAPVEIVAKNPAIVTAPFDGIVEKIYVSPGMRVSEGDDLAIMDQTTLQIQYDTANQALQAAQSAFSQAGLESLRTSEKKADLQALKLDIKAKKIELEHMKGQLKKSNVQSSQNGVAIFSDINELKGKPIRAGEKIMMIADPEDSELLIRVPSQTLLPVSITDELSFFVNTNPLDSYSANITSIGYQASQDADGLLTYKIRAKIKNANEFRIGWKGTAKIKTEWSVLGYALLRRPMIAFRNLLGI